MQTLTPLPELRQSVISTEYVLVPVTGRKNGVAYNLAALSVKMAFKLRGVTPVSGDWKTADWETSPSPVVSPATTTYWARCLIGPGGAFVPVAAKYAIWLKITDSPEIPANPVAWLRVF